MDRWEYKSILCEGPTMENMLAQLGEQGWEAVGFVAVSLSAEDSRSAMSFGIFMVTKWGASQYRVLLKRRK